MKSALMGLFGPSPPIWETKESVNPSSLARGIGLSRPFNRVSIEGDSTTNVRNVIAILAGGAFQDEPLAGGGPREWHRRRPAADMKRGSHSRGRRASLSNVRESSMTMSLKKCMATFATAALIAVAVSACGGGGGGDGPTTNGTNGDGKPTAVDLSDVTPDFMAEAGLVTILAGESEVHGDIAFACAADGDDCTVTVTVDDDGIWRAESTGGLVTTMNSEDYSRRVSIREELASLIEESSGEMSLTHRVTASSGSAHLQLAQSNRSVISHAVPWRDGNGDLNFSISLGGEELPADSAIAYQGRTISGGPDSLIPIQDHALRRNSQIDWQLFSTTKDYDGAGTLEVQFVTDVEDSEAPGQIFVGYGEGADGRTILLDAIPSLDAGHDWQGVYIDPQGSLAGSLDGVDGEFSCYGGQFCGLEIEPANATPGYYPRFGTVVFTPSDGSTPEVFSETASAPVPTVDYLSFGIWQYVPDDVESGSFDFGVFAGGGDPFNYTNGEALTGSATYVGDAIGTYFATVTSDYLQGDDPAASSPVPFPVTGSFTADVSLTAEFGTSVGPGMVSGRVHDFRRGGESWSNMEVFLREAPITTLGLGGDHLGAIGDASRYESKTTSDMVLESGVWSAAFFGNNPNDPSAHPTGVAGTFGVASDEFGMLGAFGAHKQ